MVGATSRFCVACVSDSRARASGTYVLASFYAPVRLRGAVVFDPFMGSGTTGGEARKAAACAVGRDIDPVAYVLVSTVQRHHDVGRVAAEYASIGRYAADTICSYYRGVLPDGTTGDVLYYFWVMVVACPQCASDVPLRRTCVFVRLAKPTSGARAVAVCPTCAEVQTGAAGGVAATCERCGHCYDAARGPARSRDAACAACQCCFTIAAAVAASGFAPRYAMYAKRLVSADGTKPYMRVTDSDEALYGAAAVALAAHRPVPAGRYLSGAQHFPVVPLQHRPLA